MCLGVLFFPVFVCCFVGTRPQRILCWPPDADQSLLETNTGLILIQDQRDLVARSSFIKLSTPFAVEPV